MLIEVMVALAIVAIALSALVNNLNTLSDSHHYLRDQMVSRWVAANQLNQVFIEKKYFSQKPKQRGKVKMMSQQWDWQLKTSKLDNNRLERWELKVKQAASGSTIQLQRLVQP